MMCTYYPTCAGSVTRRIEVQTGPVHNCKTLFKKMTKAKSVGDVAKIVAHLPSKWEGLSSNPYIYKKNLSWARMTHAYNPSYSGGRNQEDLGSKPAWAYRSRDPISEKTHHKKRRGGW
jgi:hypothetical protein